MRSVHYSFIQCSKNFRTNNRDWQVQLFENDEVKKDNSVLSFTQNIVQAW